MTLMTWAVALLGCVLQSQAPAGFDIRVERSDVKDNLVRGQLSVNGEVLGNCYENDQLKIPAGVYKAHLRYKSSKNHVQGPGGKLSTDGDFLIELDSFLVNGKERTAIQFHAGSLPEHSDGCILCGPATTDPKTMDKIAPPPLKQLRLKFFGGNDRPNASPNRIITVTVTDFKK